MDLARRVAAACRWQRALGMPAHQARHCLYVVTPEHPDTWDANHVAGVTAATTDTIEAVFELIERAYRHSDWRVVQTDPFTPPAFIAELAMRGYAPVSTMVQMALEGTLAAEALSGLSEVDTDADWAQLTGLIRANYAEEARASGVVSDAVVDGLVAGYRAKPEMRFLLAQRDGVPIAYAARLACPDGLGMIEHLFTLPGHRRQGIGSGLIAAQAERLRTMGCDALFLGALADDTPKHLYRGIGFRPLLLTQCWVRRGASLKLP